MTLIEHCDIAGPFSECDFYAKVEIGDEQFKSGTIDNDNDISPSDWTFKSAWFPTTHGSVPVSIQIYDNDVGDDAHIDISKGEGKDLNLTVDLVPCSILSSTEIKPADTQDWSYTGACDTILYTESYYSNGGRTAVWFKVEVTDVEDCNGIDDDGDGWIDEDIGSCLGKFLFVPFCWLGDPDDFEVEVNRQLDIFYDALNLNDCRDSFNHEILHPNTANIECPKINDISDPVCAQARKLASDAVANAGLNKGDYNEIVAITDHDICGTVGGAYYGRGFFWLESGDNISLCHEFGHLYDLSEEYTSELAGGCFNDEDSINYLGADLGCDPEGDCCGGCTENCKPCCAGNENSNGGRCFMGASDQNSWQLGYCDRCFNQITDPVKPRTSGFPNGAVPLQCGKKNELQPQSLLDVSYGVKESGDVVLYSLETYKGRPSFGGSSSIGPYTLKILKLDAVILETSFDLYSSPNGAGFDDMQIFPMGWKAVVPDDVTETDVLKIQLYKDGVLTGQTIWNAPDLKAEKTVDLTEAIPGDTLTYGITVSNIGTEPATSIELTDTFPDGAVVSMALSDLAGGASSTETFNYVVPFPIADNSVLTNKAVVTGTDLSGNPDENPSNNADEVSTIVHIPILTLSKTATNSVNAGEVITYTITYENTGSEEAKDVVITDTLPQGVYYSQALDSGAGPSPDSITREVDGTTTLRWNIGSLPPGSASSSIEFTARPSLIFRGGDTVGNHIIIDFTDRNGNDYPEPTADVSTTINSISPGKNPKTLGFYMTHPEVWTSEVLAMIQATDTRFDGSDGSTPDHILSASEIAAVLSPGGAQPKILEMQLLAAYFNLATREINANTRIESKLATKLRVADVGDAVVYAHYTLALPVIKANLERYSNTTDLLDAINRNKVEVY